jgi:hypothetical protein
MIHSQRNSYHLLLSPTATFATDNATPYYVDTQPTTGAQPNYLTIAIGTEASTNAVLTSFNAVESDDTNATNFANITGFVAGTDYTASDATGDGTYGASIALDIDLRGRKRYVGFIPVAANTTYNSVAAFGILGRYGEDPGTVADVHVKG